MKLTRISDEELSKFIEFPVEGYTSNRAGVAQAQLEACEKEAQEKVKEIWNLLLMAREELCFGGAWTTARNKIDKALKQKYLEED